jgi:general secretion pathway protein G
VPEISFLPRHLPASILLGMIAGAAYLIAYGRHRSREFGLFDAMVVVTVMAIATAMAMPLLNAASDQTSASALLQNLHTLRNQIELYKVEHGGQPPLVYEGTFPQLMHATNAQGIPGPPGEENPYGPYLPTGIPVNPYTGSSRVTQTESFPPEAASGAGGWLYHPQTGRIAPDLDGHLTE